MNINISGHHVDVTDAMRQHVLMKMERVIRHFDHINSVDVTVSVEKQEHKAEATLHVSGSTIFAAATDDQMYTAIDRMVDKLDQQVRRHKEKLTDHHRAEGGLKSQPHD